MRASFTVTSGTPCETMTMNFDELSEFQKERKRLARKYRESSFHHCGGALKLVQSCLCGRKDQERRLHHYEGAVKLVEAYLSDRMDRDSSFHHSTKHLSLIHI